MIPGINPKKMQAMMKQMGMSQDEIDANRVIIETDDGNIIINEPSVVKINMQGQESFQITGEVSEEEVEEEVEDNNEEDLKTIMEKTDCTQEEAKKALEESNNDLTEAILSLS
jgi:nascent polypeptide-associated complex subunit alpha